MTSLSAWRMTANSCKSNTRGLSREFAVGFDRLTHFEIVDSVSVAELTKINNKLYSDLFESTILN